MIKKQYSCFHIYPLSVKERSCTPTVNFGPDDNQEKYLAQWLFLILKRFQGGELSNA